MMAKATVEIEAVKKEKPGWKSTEFVLATLAQLMGILMASGVVESGSTWDKGIGLVVMALSSMGYSASRATVKKAASNA